MTDYYGNVVSTVDMDPWGGETNRSVNQSVMSRRYTSYERDGNGGDEAQMRRYQSRWTRFSQPDPWDGSYNLSDPQSLNRYSYVQNDPVNYTDPSGLDPPTLHPFDPNRPPSTQPLEEPIHGGSGVGVFIGGFGTGFPLYDLGIDAIGIDLGGGDFLGEPPQQPVPQPAPTPAPPVGPCAWEEERDMNILANTFGSVFNYTLGNGNQVWGFKPISGNAVQQERRVTRGLAKLNFTVFFGLHSGTNYEGQINGNWYHIAVDKKNDSAVIENHFELDQPSSWAHKMRWFNGTANKWVRPSQRECDRRRERSN